MFYVDIAQNNAQQLRDYILPVELNIQCIP